MEPTQNPSVAHTDLAQQLEAFKRTLNEERALRAKIEAKLAETVAQPSQENSTQKEFEMAEALLAPLVSELQKLNGSSEKLTPAKRDEKRDEKRESRAQKNLAEDISELQTKATSLKKTDEPGFMAGIHFVTLASYYAAERWAEDNGLVFDGVDDDGEFMFRQPDMWESTKRAATSPVAVGLGVLALGALGGFGGSLAYDALSED